MDKVKNDYQKLASYWDDNFNLREEEIIDLKTSTDFNYLDLAPSLKLIDVIKRFKGSKKVLDYGTGNGWAAIAMAENGVTKVDACDVSPNAIKMLEIFINKFNLQEKINPFVINPNWLEGIKEEYDGFFSSNVIDVIPLEMAKEIIKWSYNAVKEGSLVIFSTNYHLDLDLARAKGMALEGNQLYIDGVLRLTSLSDEEWLDIFKEYYHLEEIIYFAWPQEEKETRRIFVLRK